jgi:hypothetical protein
VTYLRVEVVKAIAKDRVEEELVVPDSTRHVLLLKHLVVVYGKACISSTVSKAMISILVHGVMIRHSSQR